MVSFSPIDIAITSTYKDKGARRLLVKELREKAAVVIDAMKKA
jgi:hypothetical protein